MNHSEFCTSKAITNDSPMPCNCNFFTFPTSYQKANSFDAVTLKKISKGALIAASGAVLTYLAQVIGEVDFGQFTPVVVALGSIAINAAREYLKGE